MLKLCGKSNGKILYGKFTTIVSNIDKNFKLKGKEEIFLMDVKVVPCVDPQLVGEGQAIHVKVSTGIDINAIDFDEGRFDILKNKKHEKGVMQMVFSMNYIVITFVRSFLSTEERVYN